MNDTIIKEACKAIDDGRKRFGMGESMIFHVEESDSWQYLPGSMPTYFNHNDKRYVLYKIPNKKNDQFQGKQ